MAIYEDFFLFNSFCTTTRATTAAPTLKAEMVVKVVGGSEKG